MRGVDDRKPDERDAGELEPASLIFAGRDDGCLQGVEKMLRAFTRDCREQSPDFGDVGYDTTADGPGNQGMPFNGNVGLGPYSVCIYSQ